jgi:splicing factor 3B subunit 3
MHLLNLTLSPPTNISLAAVGSFSGTKGQEIIAVRGSTKLEILKLNPTTGQRELRPHSRSDKADQVVDTICSSEAFGVVRNVSAFRLAGMTKGKLS